MCRQLAKPRFFRISISFVLFAMRPPFLSPFQYLCSTSYRAHVLSFPWNVFTSTSYGILVKAYDSVFQFPLPLSSLFFLFLYLSFSLFLSLSLGKLFLLCHSDTRTQVLRSELEKCDICRNISLTIAIFAFLHQFANKKAKKVCIKKVRHRKYIQFLNIILP